MEFRMEPFGGPAMLILDGEVTVERAEELRKNLIRCLEEADEVIVDLEKVAGVDLSCLQLLCSAHRTAAAAGKGLVLGRTVPEVFTRAIRDAGYWRHGGCTWYARTSCLWSGGE